MKTALLIGATGMTGQLVLQLLLNHADYKKVTVYSRRALDVAHPKLEVRLIDFDTYNEAVAADDVYCCIGTTIKKAGSQAAFEQVDYHYPLKIAQLQRGHSRQFLLISAMGANAQSRVFYNRIKGRLEQAISALNYDGFLVFRPSLIAGARQERRPSERVLQTLMRLINPLLIGRLKPYQSVQAQAIAQAMVHYGLLGQKGQRVFLSDEIKAFERAGLNH